MEEPEDRFSIHTGKIRTFGTTDYVLFVMVLAISGIIGLFYAIKDRKNVNTKEFMLAGKSMSVVPVALSLAVTFLSATSLLGNPVEVYNFNTMFWYLLLALLLAVAAATNIFVPFFYNLKVTTVMEYLQLRFNTPVRVLGSVIIIMQTLVYFSFILYTPSLALSSVTNISLWGSVIGMGLVVTFYTTLGGMKAVVWTDTFQAAIIASGLLAPLIKGAVLTGGFAHAWQVAKDRGRIKFDDFSLDPSVRHSFWSVVIGGGFFWMSLYGVNQAQVQRCISCTSVRNAQIALWVNLPFIATIASMGFMIGVVMFAFYSECHPIGIISKRDQLLPLFVMDTLADYQGIPGIFVACIFSGSLSSLSSGLNAISSVTIKDLIMPFCFNNLTDFQVTILTKLIVIVYGGIGMACAYLVGTLGRVLQASYSMYSILNGPMFGLFMLGMFCPWANSIGAFAGCMTSLAFMSWIGIGAFYNKVSTAKLSPVIYTGCTWRNATALVTTTPVAAAVVSNPKDIPAYAIYTLSYLYYTITGAVIVVIIGLIISFVWGSTVPSSLDPRLICPLFDLMFPCLPESIRKPLRFGINHEGKYERYDKDQEAGTDNQVKITASTAPVESTPSLAARSESNLNAGTGIPQTGSGEFESKVVSTSSGVELGVKQSMSESAIEEDNPDQSSNIN